MFIADLHIHSRYSRATSKRLTIRNLAAWGAIKGIDVIGTGDFTHPGWMREIEESLFQGEDGLLHLKEPSNLESEIDFPLECKIEPKISFILSTEISSIYKKGDRVRKIHNVVVMPSIDAAKKFNKKLAQIGNLESDGRPILGLDCQHLIEMVLETHEKAFLIPAHIWTPWFSLFGSRSGFDSIEECFGSYTSEIFALETGLSSDPPMNWMWSELDRFYLVSNSDAHSGEKLGREANLFKGDVSYDTIYNALKFRTGDFLGTIEFFPEEGKYHLDGHRKCGIVLEPEKAIEFNNICPVCKQPLTIGVMHRILSLADRKKPQKPKGSPDFHSLIPLTEIISEILKRGPKTKAVYRVYKSLIKEFRSEIQILMQVPVEELKKFSPRLAMGIDKMRKGEVYKEPGFDGQYGKISLFSTKKNKAKKITSPGLSETTLPPTKDSRLTFNREQLHAITTNNTPCMVIAGPGTGKTRTIIGRTKYLIEERGVDPSKILILTFTIAASLELKERLSKEENIFAPKISTIHSLGFEILKEKIGQPPVILSEIDAKKLFLQENKDTGLWERYQYEREQLLPPSSKELHTQYIQLKKKKGLFDYTDLVEFLINYLRNNKKNLNFEHILVDEIQDLSPIQIEVIRLLANNGGEGFFGIGDPNQAIYSFRGGVKNIIDTLKQIYPNLQILSLEKNYRTRDKIIKLCSPLIQFGKPTIAESREKGEIFLYKAPTSTMEANWIAKQIKKLIGATSHMEADLGKTGPMSPSDIAVLVRFKGLIPPIKKALDKMGIPCNTPEEINFYDDPNVEKFLQLISSWLEDKEGPLNGVTLSNLRDVKEKLVEHKIFDPLFFSSNSFKKLENTFNRLKSWKEVLGWVALQREFDAISDRAQKVCITTIHASKGLEFEAVFLPALEEDIIPFSREKFSRNENVVSTVDMYEEERLLFVGITRAKAKLFLSYAQKREVFGKKFSFGPSPFLKKLKLDLAVKIRARLKKRKKIVDIPLS